jgi:hypothetical protein
MPYNGPAIMGGYVTWRSHPAKCPGALAEKLSRWQDRYGVLFAVQVENLIELYECRGARLISGWVFIPVRS